MRFWPEKFWAAPPSFLIWCVPNVKSSRRKRKGRNFSFQNRGKKRRFKSLLSPPVWQGDQREKEKRFPDQVVCSVKKVRICSRSCQNRLLYRRQCHCVNNKKSKHNFLSFQPQEAGDYLKKFLDYCDPNPEIIFPKYYGTFLKIKLKNSSLSLLSRASLILLCHSRVSGI